MKYYYQELEKALLLLNIRLKQNKAPQYNLIVCGGSALIATNLIQRVTKDVDIVALFDKDKGLIDPEPLPDALLKAAKEVAEDLNLPKDWLNNGPSHGDGGIFRLGLPDGLFSRCVCKKIGTNLTVFFIGRLDQIHLKLYAAVDQLGGYHADDLAQLKPTDEELLQAALWSISHDPSEGYKQSLKLFLKEAGYENVIDRF